MHEVRPVDFSRIAQDLQIRKVQVESVAALLDAGNSVPFIARYRRDVTGGFSEDVIRQIKTRLYRLRQLGERKQTILKSIEAQGKLTEDLRRAIQAADASRRLDDLYAAFKPKKKTPGAVARERGLEPAAMAIWKSDPAIGAIDEFLPTLVNPEKELPTAEDVRTGVRHLLAEIIAETAEVRGALRTIVWETGRLCAAKNEQLPANEGLEFKDFFEFTEPAKQIPAHRILALNRGEKEGILRIRLECDKEAMLQAALASTAEAALQARQAPASGPAAAPIALDTPVIVDAWASSGLPAPEAALPEMQGELLSPHSSFKSAFAGFLKEAIAEALDRVLVPQFEREVRHDLRDEAEDHAVTVFARNLRSLLLQPPLRTKRVLSIDPGFRAGCRLAALDEAGNLLEDATIHPHPPKKGRERGKPGKTEAKPPETPVGDPLIVSPWSASSFPVVFAEPMPETPGAPSEPKDTGVDRREEAKSKICELVTKHQIPVIAIGNGSGCRETEEIVSDLIASRLPDVSYVIVNEAGASVYSISPIGREEFPNIDSSLRATISIGRRLQDPLSELVKVDPQSIGVGLYQHDVNRRELRETLDAVVESCVNLVGVDLNKAGISLLRHVSGLNAVVARDIVEHRKQHGPFTSREQLQQVPSLGPQRYAQAAGFVKVPESANPFDRTWVHPESYALAEKILGELGYTPDVVPDPSRNEELRSKLRAVPIEETAARLGVGPITLDDIFFALAKPSEDPRDELPAPVFKKGMLKFDDLQPGMELKGTVLNVVDFGAFVDIGLKESGLVHISQMANRYIKNPYEVVAVSDVVAVWVLAVDKERHRVSLTMIRPGAPRREEERQPRAERPRPQGDRPPPGRRQGGPPQQRGGPRPQRGARPPSAPSTAPTGEPAPAPTSQAKLPPPPPRRPRREPPKAKLTQEALDGKVPLRTFGELSALFAAKQTPPPRPEPVKAEPAPEPIPSAIEAATVPAEEKPAAPTPPSE